MKLGLQLGYWGAQPPANAQELVTEADTAGFDAVRIEPFAEREGAADPANPVWRFPWAAIIARKSAT